MMLRQKILIFFRAIKWKYIKLYVWINRNTHYCPTHHTKLKKRYCKKCDLIYWRGSKITIINPDYKKGLWGGI